MPLVLLTIRVVGGLRKIVEHGLAQQLGVQRRHAVDAMGADEGEMRHAHAPLAVPPAPAIPTKETRALCSPRRRVSCRCMPVDQVDDLQMARQQPAEQVERPAFQRFGQQRVVGVAQRRARDRPRLLPREFVLVDQDPHQLGDRDGWMRVVELDRRMLGQLVQRGELVEMPPDQVLQRCRGEEILLPQPQLLALRRCVVRIEHARDRLGPRARRRWRRRSRR